MLFFLRESVVGWKIFNESNYSNMKNQLRLLWANAYALVSVLSILAVVVSLEIELGVGVSGLVAKMSLFVIPQLGFVYYLLKGKYRANKKVLA